MNMKLLFLSILAVSVFAFDPCPTNNRNRPACCSVDVLKVADLDCETRKYQSLYAMAKAPRTYDTFTKLQDL